MNLEPYTLLYQCILILTLQTLDPNPSHTFVITCITNPKPNSSYSITSRDLHYDVLLVICNAFRMSVLLIIKHNHSESLHIIPLRWCPLFKRSDSACLVLLRLFGLVYSTCRAAALLSLEMLKFVFLIWLHQSQCSLIGTASLRGLSCWFSDLFCVLKKAQRIVPTSTLIFYRWCFDVDVPMLTF